MTRRTPSVVRLVRRPAVTLVVVLLAVLVGACSKIGPAPLSISLVGDDDSARVVVAGLSTQEAAALRAASFDAHTWNSLLRVSAGSGEVAAVAGRYIVTDRAIEFAPAFPFDPGRPYRVILDPGKLPTPRPDAPIVVEVRRSARAASPPVSVTRIYPSPDIWPENLLRFYIHFSGPMARATADGLVRLFDSDGREVTDALLASSLDFWSPDQTRYTVLFEPGRVKRGVQPNREMGRALEAGRRYTIVVSDQWRDAERRPIEHEYRRAFTAGSAREAALSLSDWRISSPARGTREPLVVTVPAPLDNALLSRTVGVMSAGRVLDGRVEVVAGETEWRFTPESAWVATPHELAVLSALEDPAGNRIGRAFEVLPSDPSAAMAPPERFSLPLIIK